MSGGAALADPDGWLRSELRFAAARMKAYSEHRWLERLKNAAMRRAIAEQVERYGALIPPQMKRADEETEAADARIRREIAAGTIVPVPIPVEYR